MKRWLLLLLCLLALPVLAKKPAPLLLGGVFQLEGPQADLDRPTLHGAQMALAEINARGGVLGRPLHLVQGQGKDVAARTAHVLRQNPALVALLGLSDTDLVLQAAPAAARSKRLFLTTGATSPKLPAQAGGDVFLACFGDNVQAAAAAEWAYNKRAARTATIVYDASDTYTVLLHQYFRKRFEELGGRVLEVKSYSETPGADIARLPTADVVFLAAHTSESALTGIHLLRAAGISAPIIGGDGYDSETFWAKHPEVNQVFYTSHGFLAGTPFATTYQQRYGHPPNAFAALGYDGVYLLAEAIKRAGNADPQKVRKALQETTAFSGVTGRISYRDGSRIPQKSVSVLEVAAGRIRLAEQFVPKGVPTP